MQNATPPGSIRSCGGCLPIRNGSRQCPSTRARSVARTLSSASRTSSRRWHVDGSDAPRELDLTSPRRVHIVGIGGAGMSAIATVLAAMGHRVSGSDLKESAGLARLRALGICVTVGHASANLPDGVDAVTISTAIPARNPEVVAAVERGVPVLRRAEALAAIAATRRSVAVAGTHGKTTTSSMLALVLVEAGVRPSFII